MTVSCDLGMCYDLEEQIHTITQLLEDNSQKQVGKREL